MPESFQKLFAEEYPEFADRITYSKANGILSSWRNIIASKPYKKKYHKAFSDKFRSAELELEARKELINEVAAMVSSDFHAYAMTDPATSSKTVQRIITSSYTLAKAG